MRLWVGRRSCQPGGDRAPGKISYKELVDAAPSVRELLAARGALPDETFSDYQDFLESEQEKLKTECVSPDKVPLRGSLHIPLGLVAPRKEAEEALLKEENWALPKRSK